MKPTQLFGAALLGLATSFSAYAQTPVLGTPGAPVAPGTPVSAGTPVLGAGAVVPGQLGSLNTGSLPTGPVPASATTPMGSSGQLYPANGVPTRNVDGGTLRADQPVIGNGNPATTGGQPTRRLNRGRTTAVPVRP